MNYTLLFIIGFFIQTIIMIGLDFASNKMDKKHRYYQLLQAFRVIIAASLIWLMISFFAQIYMGWITFPE